MERLLQQYYRPYSLKSYLKSITEFLATFQSSMSYLVARMYAILVKIDDFSRIADT